MKDNDKIISVLNSLIETCKDGERGYWEASEAMKYGFYRVLLRDYARQRTAFAAELQAIVRKLGGKPHLKGTMAGNLHRGWMNLRSEKEDENDRIIAKECQRGESAALKHYTDALKINPPETIRTVLEKQCAVIRSNKQRLSAIVRDDF